MKITDVEAIYLRCDEVRDVADGTQDALIVLVRTDEGVTGIGEVDSSPSVIKAIIEAPMSHSICRGLRDLVVGHDPLLIQSLWERMYSGSLYYGRRGAAIHAISGIDIALWDIAGKVHGRPVCELLGRSFRTRVRAYASEPFGSAPESTNQKAHALAEQGFTAVKFGWGSFGRSPNDDLAHVRAAREGLGSGRDLMIDAGMAWGTATGVNMARCLEEFMPYFLEEPVHPDNLEGYAQVSESTSIRIAAGEEETTRFAFRELIERGKVSVVQPDISRAGGITEVRRIASLAEAYGRLCIPHLYSTGILTSATLHVLAAIPNGELLEFCISGSPLNAELVCESFVLEDGHVRVPSGPGLGITLDERVLARFRVA